MKAAIAALQFLTVLPLPRSLDLGERALGQSVWFFVPVGLAIGVAVGGLDTLWTGYLQNAPLVAAVLVVVLLLASSGGLHLDGLADTADGFFSSRPRERILEIMKDSRSGPMGVTAIVCVLMLKVAIVASLPLASGYRVAALVLMPAAGRASLVWHMNVLSYARAEGGLGSVFVKHRSFGQALWALVLLLGVAWYFFGIPAVVAGAAALLFGWLFCLHCYVKIGGFTGDTLGASCELCELVPGLVLLLLPQMGLGL